MHEAFTYEECLDFYPDDEPPDDDDDLTFEEQQQIQRRVAASAWQIAPTRDLRLTVWALLRLGYTECGASPQRVVDFLHQRGIRLAGDDYDRVYTLIVPRIQNSKGREYRYGRESWDLVEAVLRDLAADSTVLKIRELRRRAG